MHLIAPSILSADFGNLDRDVEMINQSEADWFHIDIMDGVFVPNISFGFPVLESISRKARKPLDVHLMIVEPEKYIARFKKAGAANLSVHLEACPHLHRTLQEIRGEGMKAGVALNPHSPVSLLKDMIRDIDLVCLMSVNPGFGGQKFIEQTYAKIRELKAMINDAGSNTLIEIDGGVDIINAPTLIQAGADVLVAGNSVFKAEDAKEMISKLKSLQDMKV